MDEITILEQIQKFVSGNTVVLLYIAISVTRYILIPIYKGGSVIKDFASAATNALNSSASGHEAIAAELKVLGKILSGP